MVMSGLRQIDLSPFCNVGRPTRAHSDIKECSSLAMLCHCQQVEPRDDAADDHCEGVALRYSKNLPEAVKTTPVSEVG